MEHSLKTTKIKLLSDIVVSLPAVHWCWHFATVRHLIPESLSRETELFPHLTPPSRVHCILPQPAPAAAVPIPASASPTPSSPAELRDADPAPG
ncbi:hypothetical protein TNCT_234091 [Trichonephila clavata]|uniref:Uncharacterized protein n=1 Tax=Trichonephila clavata TaxID=2740835 RepID=A0A8X6GVU0_TRICU|nr:hypothetical protein TNCT_234091 [Trichonephila clavata]